ncbi:integral membrane protein [Psychromicrobium silvestre]|uniref:Integral membrane protein n=1 Tax=Psychromicrobium silvestre TaxID=1645614 RepID=A0A7Y9LT79_9MICC|nr:integral membrane protein [Psychromicrobium silvestre]
MSSPENGSAEKSRRRFGGTVAQIRAALGFYKVFAYTTGVLLLLLTAELVARYGFHSVLMAGGQDASSGAEHGFGFVSVADDGSLAVTGGVNLSTAVLIVHGWMYVVYLISDFRLWSLMRWRFGKFVLIALGGVVPFLSFFVERRIHAETLAEVAANPQGSKRY